jgi:hypothetical protein
MAALILWLTAGVAHAVTCPSVVMGISPAVTGCYPMQETTGTTITDTVAGNNGTISGAYTLNQDGGIACNNSGGSGCSIKTPTNYANPQPVTFYIEFCGTSGGLLQLGTSSSLGASAYYVLFLDTHGHLTFGINNFTTYQVLQSPLPYADGNDHKAVVSLGPAGAKMYVDGQLVAESGVTLASYVNGYLFIGGINPAGWQLSQTRAQFNGTLATVAWWNGYQAGDYQGRLLTGGIPTAITNNYCTFTNQIASLNPATAQAFAKKTLTFTTTQFQVPGLGSTLPIGPSTIQCYTDPNGNIVPGCQLPQGAHVNLSIGSGQPIPLVIPASTSCDLTAIVLSQTDPPEVVSAVAVAGPQFAGVTVTNPPAGTIGTATITSPPAYSQTQSTTANVDIGVNGNVQQVILSGNATINLLDFQNGAHFDVYVTENSVGNFAPTFTVPAGWALSWSGGATAQPPMASVAGFATSLWEFSATSGTTVIGTAVQSLNFASNLSITGAIQIAGIPARGGGLGTITNIDYDKVVDLARFAAPGLRSAFTGSIISGSNQLTLTTPWDGEVGEGVFIPGAGATSAQVAPASMLAAPIGGRIAGIGFTTGAIAYKDGTNFIDNTAPSATHYGQPNAGAVYVELSTPCDNTTNVTVNYIYNGSTAVTGEVMGVCDGYKQWFWHQLANTTNGIKPASVVVTATVSGNAITGTDADTSTYQYECSYIDALGGLGPASAPATIVNTTVQAYPAAFNELTTSAIPTTAAGQACWLQKDFSGVWIRLGPIPDAIYLDEGNSDITATGPAPDIPAIPPTAATNEHLVSYVTAISSDKMTLTLADTALNTATNVTVYHDSLVALQDWLNTAGSGSATLQTKLYGEPGTYYTDGPLLATSGLNNGAPNRFTMDGGSASRANPGGFSVQRIGGDPGLPVFNILGIRNSYFEHMAFFANGQAVGAIHVDAVNQSANGEFPDWVRSRPYSFNSIIQPLTNNAGGYLFVEQGGSNCVASQTNPAFPQVRGQSVIENTGTNICGWLNIGTPGQNGITNKNTFEDISTAGGQGINSYNWLIAHPNSVSQADVQIWHDGENIGYNVPGLTRYCFANASGFNNKNYFVDNTNCVNTQEGFDFQSGTVVTIRDMVTAGLTGDGMGDPAGVPGECMFRSNAGVMNIENEESEDGVSYGIMFACGNGGTIEGHMTIMGTGLGSTIHPGGWLIATGSMLVLMNNRFNAGATAQCPKILSTALTSSTSNERGIVSIGNSYDSCTPNTSVFYNGSQINIGPGFPSGPYSLISENDYTADYTNSYRNAMLPSMDFTGKNILASIVATKPPVTPFSGTSGSASCSMSLQGTLKVATCSLTAYVETGTAETYPFPIVFTTTPVLLISGGSCGTYNPTANSIEIFLPANAAMTAETCNIVAEGQ